MPVDWRGINYGPRGHQFHRMLYNWNQAWTDPYGTTKTVKQWVADDMLRLSELNVNVIHHYIWDNKVLKKQCEGLQPMCSELGGEAKGFVEYPANPNGSLMNALDELLGLAETRGISVVLHFASGQILDNKANAGEATPYADYIKKFIHFLVAVKGHRNIIGWGIGWSLFAGDAADGLLQALYNRVKQDATQECAGIPNCAPGLVGVDVQMDLFPDGDFMYLRPASGHTFQWQSANSQIAKWRSLLGNNHADFYFMQIYHPNSKDIRFALQQIKDAYPGIEDRIFASEWGTGASLRAIWFDLPSWGDNTVPTSTPEGQRQWMENTLCVFASLGIRKGAYWTMYDTTFWLLSPFYMSDEEFGWYGFWGLAYEYSPFGNKPSYNQLAAAYNHQRLQSDHTLPPCSASQVTEKPGHMTLTPSSRVYTIDQPIRVRWSAFDVSSLSLNRAFHGNFNGEMREPGSYDCALNKGANPPGYPYVKFPVAHPGTKPPDYTGETLEGSCAFADLTPATSAGSLQIQLTGAGNGSTNSNPVPTSETIMIVSEVPILGVFGFGPSILPGNPIYIYGQAFSIPGGNEVEMTPTSGGAERRFYQGNTSDFTEGGHGVISFRLPSDMPLGTYWLRVWNGYRWSAQQYVWMY